MPARHSIAVVLTAAAALAGCTNDPSEGWTKIPPGDTEFRQAHRTCEDQLEFVADESERTDFYVKCMAALGWVAGPAANLEP
jgi:hypothetical protein